MKNPNYCYACQEESPRNPGGWGKVEAVCGRCGEKCCRKHWLYRGVKVAVTELGTCMSCDYEAYRSSPMGM